MAWVMAASECAFSLYKPFSSLPMMIASFMVSPLVRCLLQPSLLLPYDLEQGQSKQQARVISF
jgi:hypothetical protein